jgi:hypothetical protein
LHTVGIDGAIQHLASVISFPSSHLSKSRIVEIVLVIPAAMQGVILIAEFIRTKLYHATQSAAHALRFSSLRLCGFILSSRFQNCAGSCDPLSGSTVMANVLGLGSILAWLRQIVFSRARGADLFNRRRS